MAQQSGDIIFTSSIAGIVAVVWEPIYTASTASPAREQQLILRTLDLMRGCVGDAKVSVEVLHSEVNAMRTTLNIAEDALLAARHVAQREHMSLGDAVSELVRRGATAGGVQAASRPAAPLRGRFALLPVRDEVVTPQHVRDLMEREGI